MTLTPYHVGPPLWGPVAVPVSDAAFKPAKRLLIPFNLLSLATCRGGVPWTHCALVCLIASWLVGCEPTFNWRKVDFSVAGLELMLPCKPDRAVRTLPVGPRAAEFQMVGCETGGISFTVTSTMVADSAEAQTLSMLWREATRRQLGLRAGAEHPFQLASAATTPAAGMVSGQGRKDDGSTMFVQVAHFGHGRRLYQAMMLSGKPNPQAAESFFSGLRLP